MLTFFSQIHHCSSVCSWSSHSTYLKIPVYFWGGGASGPPSSSTVFNSAWHSWEVQSCLCLCSLRCWTLIRAEPDSDGDVFNYTRCCLRSGPCFHRGVGGFFTSQCDQEECLGTRRVGKTSSRLIRPLRLLFLKGRWSGNRKWWCPVRWSRYHVQYFSIFCLSKLKIFSQPNETQCLSFCGGLESRFGCSVSLRGGFASVWSCESLFLSVMTPDLYSIYMFSHLYVASGDRN